MKLKELRKMLDTRQISAEELAAEYINKSVKDTNNCYISLCTDDAEKAAKAAQVLIDKGTSMPMTGIPVSVKDNICTKGIKTTCASKMLKDFVPSYDAHAVELLKNECAIIIGKTNMDEFAMGRASQNSYYGGVKNPLNSDFVPGGSSGGAAASVKAGLCAAAIATDTGGSIRQPAAFCGVCGFKPTYGTVSRHGLIAFASSLDQIGVIANSAEDTGYVLNTIACKDGSDMTSKNTCEDFTSHCGMSIKGLRIGIPKEFFQADADKEVLDAVISSIEILKNSGAEIIECSLPSFEYVVPAYYLISSAEAASNLSRYDGVKYGYKAAAATYEELIERSRSEAFGIEVKRRILLGNYALSKGFYNDYYKKALRIRNAVKYEYNRLFESCDVVISPTAPSTAFKISEADTNPIKAYTDDLYTVTANLAGLPSVSVPCGYVKNGMPIGMSITGKAFSDSLVIGVADAFEKIVKECE